MVPVLAVLGAWEDTPCFPEVRSQAGQVRSLFLCTEQWRQLSSVVILVQVPALHLKTEPACAELLAVSGRAGLESVKSCLDPSGSFIPHGNLSLGLTQFSDLLKLLVHGIFASWTATSYVGYASGADMSGPIKKSCFP